MPLTYTNPVWPGYLADPFVLKWQGEYFAYGTGGSAGDRRQSKGHVFPILHSTDFVHWEQIGGALVPLAGAYSAYWAPEVAARDGHFYLYYSAADDAGDDTHRLRVAVADHPAGPFTDSGRLLLPDEGFTIDAHPFRDPKDGRWYLFFAKDFFDARVGTALAVVPLADDMVSVNGPVTTVLRPSADWQIHARDRTIYGRTWDAWHTVEGAFVVVHGGRYYLLYSGGAWHTAEYGVGYAVADSILGPYSEPEAGPAVLRGVPGHVFGPGHNSVVLGPDDQTEFIAYHAWDAAHTARRLCLDPLVWTEDGPTLRSELDGADLIVTTDEPFNFPLSVSFHAWHGEATIADRLLSEWGWVIERREPANSEALVRFLVNAPEPGTTEEREQALLSHWHEWHVLVTYFSFGALREIYSNYPVPIIEFTVPAGSELNQLGDMPNFYLDLMVDQRFYFAYVRDGALWRDHMQNELHGRSNGHLVLQGNEPVKVEWLLKVGAFPGYGFEDRVAFSSDLGWSLQQLGLPLQHWQNRDQDILNEVLDILH